MLPPLPIQGFAGQEKNIFFLQKNLKLMIFQSVKSRDYTRIPVE
jgi:hypothetical protein